MASEAPTREKLHPALVRRTLRERDVAYGCYLYFGAMFAAAFVLNRIPTDLWIYRAAGAVLSFPAVFAAFVPAFLGGLVSSIRLRRERSLAVLGAVAVALPVALWAASRWEAFRGWPGMVYFTAFTVLTLALPLRWFFAERAALRRALL